MSWKPKVIDEYGGIDYRHWDYVQHQHYIRYKAYVKAHGLPCQDCGGAGGETYVILDDGTGPWESCGWCEGTGKVTRWIRGRWLQWKAQERKKRERKKAAKAA